MVVAGELKMERFKGKVKTKGIEKSEADEAIAFLVADTDHEQTWKK